MIRRVNRIKAQNLSKPVIKKFKGVPGMGSVSSVNCSVKYFIRLIDNFTKYFWAKPFDEEKS